MAFTCASLGCRVLWALPAGSLTCRAKLALPRRTDAVTGSSSHGRDIFSRSLKLDVNHIVGKGNNYFQTYPYHMLDATILSSLPKGLWMWL